MLTKDEVYKYEQMLQQIGPLEQKISDRCYEVTKLVFKFFGRRLDSFWFPDATEGGVGTLPSTETLLDEDGCIDFECESKGGKSPQTEAWDYSYSFPSCFLYMTDKEILDILEDEVAETEEKAKEKKAKAALAKEKKEAAKEKVLKKLTAAERKLLGLK